MTTDTEKALVIIFAEYLRRRKRGAAKTQAIRFETSSLSSIDAFSKWHCEDIRYSLQELKKLGFVKIDIFGDVTLQESGIKFMESKPSEYFGSFASAIKDLISLVVTLYQ